MDQASVATLSGALLDFSHASARHALEVAASTVSRANANAAKRGNIADLSIEEWLALLAAYKYRCAYCRGTGALSLDHVVPLSRGGATTLRNVVPACRTCNSRKGARRWVDVPGRERVARPISARPLPRPQRRCAYPPCGKLFTPVRLDQRYHSAEAACRFLDWQRRCQTEPHMCRCDQTHYPPKPKKPRKKYRRHKKLCASDCWCKETQ